MEIFAHVMTALTTALSVLSVLWIYRRTGRINTIHSIFGGGVVLYTMYHFYTCSILGIVDPVHSIISGLFISSVAIVNAYCSTCNAVDSVVNIGVCRRKANNNGRPSKVDRRHADSHTIFKSIVKH